MNKILVALILPVFLASPCSSSDAIDSFVNERGQRIYTNIGTGAPLKAENMDEKVNTVIEDILSRHPEMNSDKADKMIQLQDHFIKSGNAADWALLKAEKVMIRDGILIDHEAVAAEKIAVEKRRQREAMELEKQLLAIQIEETKREKLRSIREKGKLRRRGMADAEEEEERRIMAAAEEAEEGEERKIKRRNENNGSATINNSSGWDTQGRHHTPAGGGNLWRSDGSFMQKAAGGYIDTKTGQFVPASNSNNR